MAEEKSPYVSRAGLKLAHALDCFGIDPSERVCADLGCSTGGFTDVLLRRGARRVYAVDTGYGVLDWSLRRDEKVVVMERTNALHVELPEACGLVVIDAGWTRLGRIVPRALSLLAPGGEIVALIKPHYEAPRDWLCGGLLPPERHAEVLDAVLAGLEPVALALHAVEPSPIVGAKGGNREFLLHLGPRASAD